MIKRSQPPRGLRELLRPGPRPWFHRLPAPSDRADPGHGTPHGWERHTFDRLVALYAKQLSLQDRALAETHVGEDALSVGDALKAAQHFAFGDDYRRRAAELERAIERHVAALSAASDRAAELATTALRRARQQRYGSADIDERLPFA